MRDNRLNDVDWNELWKTVISQRQSYSDNRAVEFWDDFAPHYRRKGADGTRDIYVERFYELMETKPSETIFDMGCASGTLAIPYAKRGHEIFAADFSPKMLEVLMHGAEEEGVAHLIHPILLDWNENWDERELPVCDIAISSRSSLFKDLTSSLKKLESVASRRVCVGVWNVPTKTFDRYVAKAIGYGRPGLAPHSIIMGELIARDVCPEMLTIESPFRLPRYESFEEGVKSLKESFPVELSAAQEQKLIAYCQDHLIHRQETEDYWQLDHSEISNISFIRWDKAKIVL